MEIYLVCLLLLTKLSLTFQMHGQDFPPNPMKKKGWKLVRHDEFNAQRIDSSLWIPFYFRHRTDDSTAKAQYIIRDGCLVLELAGEKKKNVSSIQTFERHDLHKKGNRKDVKLLLKFTQKYGYFEIRAKTQAGSGHHCAFWMVGQQNRPNENSEIDIFEQPGNLGNSTVLMGMHPWDDMVLKSKLSKGDVSKKVRLQTDLSTTFNIYGLEWTKEKVSYYLNNKCYLTVPASPQYPMGFLLSLYQGAEWTGAIDPNINYPKQFTIDYFRAYKAIPSNDKTPIVSNY